MVAPAVFRPRHTVADAVEMGAAVAEHQPQDGVRVFLDPAGHPLCHYLGG